MISLGFSPDDWLTNATGASARSQEYVCISLAAVFAWFGLSALGQTSLLPTQSPPLPQHTHTQVSPQREPSPGGEGTVLAAEGQRGQVRTAAPPSTEVQAQLTTPSQGKITCHL